MANIQLFKGFYTSQVVSRISFINSMGKLWKYFFSKLQPLKIDDPMLDFHPQKYPTINMKNTLPKN